jgi:hypothetical protein
MSDLSRTLTAAPGGELARAIEEALAHPLRVKLRGSYYRVRVEPEPDADLNAGYDPEAVRAAVREFAGSWSDIDAERMIADLYRWRDEGSRPDTRP